MGRCKACNYNEVSLYDDQHELCDQCLYEVIKSMTDEEDNNES